MAAQIHGNTRLEIGWTVGAAVILVVLTVFTFVKLNAIKNPPASDPGGLNTANGAQFASVDQPKPPGGKFLEIAVNGQQFVWRYTYPDKDSNPLNNVYSYELMVVPVDTTVVLDIESQDVAHSWWIPKLGGKFDAIPGYVNHTWFKISKPGVYYGPVRRAVRPQPRRHDRPRAGRARGGVPGLAREPEGRDRPGPEAGGRRAQEVRAQEHRLGRPGPAGAVVRST